MLSDVSNKGLTTYFPLAAQTFSAVFISLSMRSEISRVIICSAVCPLSLKCALTMYFTLSIIVSVVLGSIDFLDLEFIASPSKAGGRADNPATVNFEIQL
jgi:hypothetical protein